MQVPKVSATLLGMTARLMQKDLRHASYPRDIRDHVRELRRLAHLPGPDFEALHSYEIAIHQRVLEIIVANAGTDVNNHVELAQEVLKTKRIKFRRVTA